MIGIFREYAWYIPGLTYFLFDGSITAEKNYCHHESELACTGDYHSGRNVVTHGKVCFTQQLYIPDIFQLYACYIS